MPLMRRFFLKVCSMVWSFVFSGLEKYELLAKLAGNEDPFFLRAVTRGKVWTANIWVSMIKTFSIFREPRKTPPLLTLWTTTGNIELLIVQIMHYFQLRMVGCVCAEEDTNIKWTWLSEVLSQFSWRFLIPTPSHLTILGCPQEVRVWILDGVEVPPCPRQVWPKHYYYHSLIILTSFLYSGMPFLCNWPTTPL